MKRTTVFLDEEVQRELRFVAERRGEPAANVLREAVDQYLEGQRKKRPRAPRFIAAGRSGTRKTAQNHEEIVFRDLEPHGTDPKTRKKPPRKS